MVFNIIIITIFISQSISNFYSKNRYKLFFNMKLFRILLHMILVTFLGKKITYTRWKFIHQTDERSKIVVDFIRLLPFLTMHLQFSKTSTWFSLSKYINNQVQIYLKVSPIKILRKFYSKPVRKFHDFDIL